MKPSYKYDLNFIFMHWWGCCKTLPPTLVPFPAALAILCPHHLFAFVVFLHEYWFCSLYREAKKKNYIFEEFKFAQVKVFELKKMYKKKMLSKIFNFKKFMYFYFSLFSIYLVWTFGFLWTRRVKIKFFFYLRTPFSIKLLISSKKRFLRSLLWRGGYK